MYLYLYLYLCRFLNGCKPLCDMNLTDSIRHHQPLSLWEPVTVMATVYCYDYDSSVPKEKHMNGTSLCDGTDLHWSKFNYVKDTNHYPETEWHYWKYVYFSDIVEQSLQMNTASKIVIWSHISDLALYKCVAYIK